MANDTNTGAAAPQDERAAFEAAMVEAGYNNDFKRGPRPDSQYLHQRDEDRFVGWELARAALPAQAASPIKPEAAVAAANTLERLGYTWNGGVEWKPPIGPRPAFIDAAATVADEPVAWEYFSDVKQAWYPIEADRVHVLRRSGHQVRPLRPMAAPVQDVAPITLQDCYNEFSFLEGLVNEHTYREIGQKAFEIAQRAASPAVAKDVAPSDAREAPQVFRDVRAAVRQRAGLFLQVMAERAGKHPDDAAVDAFAAEMKDKLASARAKGRGGWQDCDPLTLSAMLRQHVEKGDPRDVANFCMFLWTLGQPIAAQPAAQPSGNPGQLAAQPADAQADLDGEGLPDEQAIVARAIWSVIREDEDRCDMELGDLRPQHSVWRAATEALDALKRARTQEGAAS